MVRPSFSRWWLAGLVLLLAPGPIAATGPASSRKAQLEFGVDMAKRGLWNEALFRFENARKLEPENASVLNNLAVCYEAAGRFEEALAAYREALKIAPANNAVKQNYSRFAEFYQGYRPRKAAADPGAAKGPEAPPPVPAPVEPPPSAEAPDPSSGVKPPDAARGER